MNGGLVRILVMLISYTDTWLYFKHTTKTMDTLHSDIRIHPCWNCHGCFKKNDCSQLVIPSTRYHVCCLNSSGCQFWLLQSPVLLCDHHVSSSPMRQTSIPGFCTSNCFLPSCTFQIYSNISSIELSYFWNPCFFFWVIYHISLPLPHP